MGGAGVGTRDDSGGGRLQCVRTGDAHEVSSWCGEPCQVRRPREYHGTSTGNQDGRGFVNRITRFPCSAPGHRSRGGHTARVLATWFDLTPSVPSVVLFALGWTCGWLLLARPRHLPDAMSDEVGLQPHLSPHQTGRARRVGVSVVVPARDEAASIGHLLGPLLAQLRDGDELVVVDDRSADATSEIAAAHGARVVSAPPLAPGWAGKPHACAAGVAVTSPEPERVLVFLDADVVPAAGLLDGLVALVARRPAALVTVQPWHRTERAHEQLSLVCNVVALMGSAAFTVFGRRPRTRVAFGPVLACRRDRYDEVGGHAHPDVRAAVLEDIALARRFGATEVFVGRSGSGDTSFRMYPAGLRAVVQGWTKGLGIGVDATPWWVLAGVAGWVWSLAGGWLVSPWMWLASALQLWVLGRVAGRFSPVAVLLHPVLTAAFTVLAVRSLVLRRLGRDVAWKGRRVRPDQTVG